MEKERIGYKVGDLVFEDFTKRMSESSRKSIGQKTPDKEKFIKWMLKGKSKYWPFKRATKIKLSQEDFDNAFKVRNYIMSNKGVAYSPDFLAKELKILSPGGKPFVEKALKALVLAKDSFKEVENFRFTTDLYPNIDSTKFKYLDMVAKSFADYKNTGNPSSLLSENMVKYYSLGPKETMDPRFFGLGYKLTSADSKYLSDRVGSLTGKTFSVPEVKETIDAAEIIRRSSGGMKSAIKNFAEQNKDIMKLYDDKLNPTEVKKGARSIQDLLKSEFNAQDKKALLARAVKVLKLSDDDVSEAGRRLFQMAEAMDPNDPRALLPGMKPDAAIANKIYQTGRTLAGTNNRYALDSLIYSHYTNKIDQAIGNIGYGKGFENYYQTKLRNAMDKGFSPDEIFSVKASARSGLAPYGIFTQKLRTDINSKIKGAKIDSALTRKHEQMQNIFKGRKWNKLLPAEKRDAFDKVRVFEQIKKDALNSPLNPKDPKSQWKYLTKVEKDSILLPEFDLKNPPEKSIEPWDDLPKNIQKAFKTSHDTVGYGMKVKAGTTTQKQLLNILQKGTTKGSLPLKAAAGTGMLALMGYGAIKNLFPGTDTSNLMTAGISGGKTIPKVDLVPGSVDQVSEEVIQEPGTTELEATDITIDQPESMAYNATEGNFVNVEGEREPQPGVLNWIAENPTKSSLMALPIGMGAGFALETASKFGNESVAKKALGSAGKYLTGWKALIPAMMIPHALHEYKAGYDLPEMATNPINALWALGIRSKGEADDVFNYYKRMKDAGRQGLNLSTLKGLKSVKGWKSLPKDFQTAMMSPAAKGTNLAFGTTFRKPFVATMKALNPEFAGVATTKAAQSWGKKALLRAALIPAGILAATPAGWLTAGLLGADFLWDQYKDFRDGKVRIDEMRARGQISEDEAKNYRSLILQGSIPFGMGNRMFGPDKMRIGGQDLDPTQQRELLKGMEAQLDEWQGGDMERRAKFREDHFADGGRVGLKLGGMDRREFLKWLAALAAGATGIFRGKGKEIVKPLVKDATKAIPAKFIGVEGMPAWFPRVIAKIKTHGKLIEMADKHYTQGDIYEMMIPVKIRDWSKVPPKYQYKNLGDTTPGLDIKTEYRKVIMEENPLTGEISMQWTGTDNFGDDAVRQINFKPGQAGYQKFGVDDPEAAVKGVSEYQRVKVEEPEFTYTQPDQSQPYRDDIEYLDIFEEGDEIVKGLEALTKTKQMIAKDGSVINVSAEGKGVDEAFQKKIYKDIEGEEQLIPQPESAGVSQKGDIHGEEEFLEIIGGDIPDHLKKKAKGGVVETGNIAREPGLVPPLSGPTPQGEGIVGLFSNPKQVNVGS